MTVTVTASDIRRAGLALLVGLVTIAATAPAGQAAGDGGERRALDETLLAVHEAGIHGTYAAATGAGDDWRGAAGVADLRTGRPVTPDMRHRIGSVTKTFTAVAVLQQVGAGRVGLDTPVADHLPELVPEGLDPAVTVRMLLNHTSGIGDHDGPLFPSLAEGSTASIDEHRFRELSPWDLVTTGLAQPPTGAPGERHAYSNTNYAIAGLLLERLTGTDAQAYITEHVIEAAGLRHTSFPRSPFIDGPHARMYESMYGLIDPARDYSVYDQSWVWLAGDVVSTMADLNRFYAALFDGRLLGEAELTEMRRTVPVTDGQGQVIASYGLGLYPVELTCGTFWGHDGSVWGSGTMAFADPDGGRQAAIGLTLQRYQTVNEDGSIEPHPADLAIAQHLNQALCGTTAPPAATERAATTLRAAG